MWYIKFCTPAYKSLGTSVSRFGVVTSQLCVFSSGPPCDHCSLGYLCLSKLVLSCGYKDSGKLMSAVESMQLFKTRTESPEPTE